MKEGKQMKKKNAAVVLGAALAGTLLTVSMQGSAQASTPPQATATLSTKATTAKETAAAPRRAAGARAARAAGRAAARATVHARAAASSVAHQASEVANNFALFHAPAKVSSDGASAAATVFDR